MKNFKKYLTEANDLSHKELMDELDEQFEIVKNNIDRIKNRFHYRMLINVSYPLPEANKIVDDTCKELKKINDQISKLWNKVG